MRNLGITRNRALRNGGNLDRSGRAKIASAANNSTQIYAVGLLDALGFVQYLFDFNQTYFYAIILFVKLAIFMTSEWDFRSIVPAIPLLGTILLGLTISSGVNSVDLIDVLRVVMAVFSIILTLVIINGDFKRYSIGLAAIGFAISALYIIQYRTGSIVEVNDRLYFFGGSHPNLGGEILSVIVILATTTLKPRAFSALFLVSSYCCWLMQSRASILAMIVSALLYAAFYVYSKFGKVHATISIFCLVVFGGLYLVIATSSGAEGPTKVIEFFYNSVFLVEDSYRGADSGLSGRDLNWYQTLEIIDTYFFAGAGIEYPRRLDILQPHNWFLYPVALFGLFGYFVIATMIHALVKVTISNKDELVRIVPILVLLMLNDRFMNMNINPLGIYVYLFARLYKPTPSHEAPQRRNYQAVRNRSRAKLIQRWRQVGRTSR